MCLTDDIHAYIEGIIRSVHGIPIETNGTKNHVHILCYLPKNMGVSDFVRTIKSNSSKWFHDKCKHMYWQTGYAVFGVSPTNIEIIRQYIKNQKEHHKRIPYQDEIRQYFADTGNDKRIQGWISDDD